MDSIFKEYGDAIISAVAAVAVISLLMIQSFGGFNGIAKALGQGMQNEDKIIRIDETQVFLNAANEVPELELSKGNLEAGENYDINEMFCTAASAEDVYSVALLRAYKSVYAGTEGNIESKIEGETESKIEGITLGEMENALSKTVIYDENIGSVKFTEPGRYRLYVRCRENKYINGWFVVTVL